MANIVFVDDNDNDNVVGAGSKKEAFEKGVNIRIIRIFLLNSKGEILMQKRSAHVAVPGKWDQSVGGHVDEGEDYLTAAEREMREELGVHDVSLSPVTKYFTETSHIGIAKRFNMLYTGVYDGDIHFNEMEVAEVKWFVKQELLDQMREVPDMFTRGSIEALTILQEQGIA